MYNSPHYDGNGLRKRDADLYEPITVNDVVDMLIAGQKRNGTKISIKREGSGNGIILLLL